MRAEFLLDPASVFLDLGQTFVRVSVQAGNSAAYLAALEAALAEAGA
jgi:hypothetical protein